MPHKSTGHEKPDVAVRDCTPEHLPGAVDVLSRAFAQETFTRLALGQRADDTRALQDLFRIQVDDHLDRGGIIDVAVIGDDVVGAAMWERPDGESDGGAGVVKNLGTYLRLTGPRALRAAAGAVRVAVARPRQPHWYLHMVGAHPDRQGLGIGSRLLEHGLQRLDRGEPAYLESSNDATSRLYAKFDFLPAGAVHLWPGFTITRMWRPAAA